jgi:predicted ATP-grasp superfamily ATP-dependent carboligase
MTFVNNLDQMMAAYREAKVNNLDVILQEYIPGDCELGANYNSYNWDGKTLVEFTAQKIRNAPPDTGSPCVLISKDIEEVKEPGQRILRALGFYGYACTEFKKDPRDGIFKLMEVNGRHNLSTLLSVRCGLNFPWLQYRHLMMGEVPEQQPFETGIYWIDISRDIGYRILNVAKERYTISQLFTPYFKQHVFATFDANDPKPAFLKSTLVVDTAMSYLSKRHSS